MTAWPALRLNVLILIVGGSAIALEIVGARMLAPFFGLGPSLESTLLAIGLLALGLGCALGGRGVNPALAASSLWKPLALAGLWTMVAPWLRRPLLIAVEPVSPALGMALATTVLLGPPLFFLGSTIPHFVRLKSAGADAGRAAGGVLATLAAGAVMLALVTWFFLVPTLGVVRTTAVIGLIQVAAALALARPARPGAATAASVLAVLGSMLAWRFGAEAASPAHGLVAIGEGIGGEYRVIDRDGARYLLHDGTIHAVIEPDALVTLHRTAAALEVLKYLVPAPGTLLLLGMRGGSVAKSFEGDGWSVRVVEPDPLAAKMAFAHFGLEPTELALATSELRRFVRRDRRTYELIVVDAFADNFIPPHLVTREYFELLAQRLGRVGILALCVEARGWDDPLVQALAATLRTGFETVLVLPTGEPPNALGGVILLASHRELELPESGLPQPYENLADPLRHWVAVQMNHAWANQYEPDSDGVAVLTDDRNPSDAWGERINQAARRELHRFFGPAGRSW